MIPKASEHVIKKDWSAHVRAGTGGAIFEGFVHVDDWVPQRLVTATGRGARFQIGPHGSARRLLVRLGSGVPVR